MSKKRLCIVIPIYNALNKLKALLKSCKKNFNFDLGRIILVDDFSHFKTRKFLKEFCAKNPDFELVLNEKNIGYIKSINKTFELANEEIIVFLNSDTIIPPDFAEKILSCFDFCPEIMAASPVSSNSSKYYIKKPLFFNIEKMNKILEKYPFKYPQIEAAEGFCFCLRRNAFDLIGKFDEIYENGYMEEIDYCNKIYSKGYKCALINDLYVIHKRNCSFGFKKRKELIEKNSEIYNTRWKEFETLHEDNPIEKIKQTCFPYLDKFKKIISKAVSIKKAPDETYSTLRILGFKFKIRYK